MGIRNVSSAELNWKSGNSNVEVVLSQFVMLNLFQHLSDKGVKTLKRVQGDAICSGQIGLFANFLIR